MSAERPKIICTRWGYYQFDPLPADEELRSYYETKYYQEGCGSYERDYDQEELKWKRLRDWLLAERAMELAPDAQCFFDVGCGEGGLMAEFHSRDLIVTGVDFSEAGIAGLHPEMLPFFRKGNVFDLIEKHCSEGKYDIISCVNVIEHVTDPARMLLQLRRGLSDDGVLVITAPNDFSPLHRKLVDEGLTPDLWWTCYPDHLSYFNKESMETFVGDHGFSLCSVVADNSIDLNLFNANSNYIRDPEKGRETHLFRVKSDLFLAEVDRKKLLRLYETYGDMGVGRNLTYYCMVAK